MASYEKAWRHYDSAYTAGGVQHKVTRITTDVTSCRRGGCTYWEDVGVDFTLDSLLKAMTQEGVSGQIPAEAASKS